MPSPFTASCYVALGGAVGSLLRYQTGRWLTHIFGPAVMTAFPWATLTVNVVGSLVMGLLAGLLARHGQQGETLRLLVGVGLLGGFTTFSAFSLDFALLVERKALLSAGAYAAGSVLCSLAAVFAGLHLARAMGH